MAACQCSECGEKGSPGTLCQCGHCNSPSLVFTPEFVPFITSLFISFLSPFLSASLSTLSLELSAYSFPLSCLHCPLTF